MIKYLGKCLLIERDNERVLAIGDLHLGYEESMNIGGVMIGRKMYGEMISYLDRVFERIGNVNVDKIVLLGDVKHNFGGVLKQEWNDFSRFMDYLSGKCNEIVIVKGNHDKIIDFIAGRKEINVCDYYIWEEYCFLHGDRDFPDIYDKRVKYWIIGHIHPAVKLKEGAKIEKYKCFLIGSFKGKNVIIVPSFIDFYEGSDVRDENIDCVWKFDFDNFGVKVVGENLEVLDFGKLCKL